MWKVAVGFIIVAASTPAPAFQDLLLPTARHILGRVVDPEGQPVAGARIDHADDRRQRNETDSDGRFTLDTRSPILVVRKAGFRSELVRTQDSTEVRVTLQKLSGGRTFPICSNAGQFEGIEGWDSSFQFPGGSDVKASRQGADIDCGMRIYYVDTK